MCLARLGLVPQTSSLALLALLALGGSSGTPGPATTSAPSAIAPSPAPPRASASAAAPELKVVMIHGAGEGKDQAKIAESDEGCARGDLVRCHALGLALMSPGKEGEDNR